MAFRKATRAGTKALIGLHGGSGSGKTFSALKLARGLVGEDGEIYMIDTESRRGEMYVGQPGIGDYQVQQLEAPYSSTRYSEMIAEAVEAARGSGKEAALVIDSMSHEWEGIGGVVSAAEAIAENAAKRYNRQWDGNVKFGDWKQPKQDHKHMVLQMLGAPLHIIVCLRSQFKSRQIEKKDYEKFGIPANTRSNSVVIRDEFQTPIQDSNFIYEMTVHAELRADRPGVPILGKCPDMLRHAFPQGEQIANSTGAAIAEWCAGGEASPTKPNNPPDSGPSMDAEAVDSLIQAAMAEARCGTEAYRLWFAGDKARADEYPGLSADSRRVLTETKRPDDNDFGQEKTVHDICKDIAAAADTAT